MNYSVRFDCLETGYVTIGETSNLLEAIKEYITAIKFDYNNNIDDCRTQIICNDKVILEHKEVNY